MRKSIFLVPLLLVSLLFLAGCDIIFPPPPPPPPPPLLEEPYGAPFDPNAITVDPATGAAIVSNQVIVRFKEGRAKATIEAVIARLDCIIIGEIPILNVYQLKTPNGADPTALVAQFANSPHVQWAEANHIIRVDAPTGSTSASEPTDPYFREQWALHNTGQTGGSVDADIDAPEAWTIEKGHPSVTIAILDTGVNYRHEDLEDNLRMPAGIVFDFIDNDTSPMDEGDPNRHGYGHGTAMTGVAAASMSDKGIVGVAPHATFLPVRVIDQGNQVDAIGEEFAVTLGILFAYNRIQARVISMSFTLSKDTYLLKDAISMLVRNNDVLLVSSAGNNDSSTPMYPAGFPGVMAVAATDHNDKRSDWGERRDWRWWPLPPGWVLVKSASNYGPWVDVSAPGGSSERMIWSTALSNNDSYHNTGGTSSAAAFVSGVAALIWSLDYRTGGGFDLSASEVRDIIEKSADNIDHLNPGFEGRLGAGRVNAHKALLEAARKLGLHEPPNVNRPDLTVSSVNLSTTLANPGDKVLVTFTIQNNGGPILGEVQNRLFLSSSQYGGAQENPFDDYPMALGDSESKSQTVEITIPQVSAGNWYIVVYTDCNATIDETNEYNNINSAAISIAEHSGPEPPEVAGKIIDYNASPREVTVPGNVTLSVTIENTGNVWQHSFYPAVDLRGPSGTIEHLPIGPITLDPGEQGSISWTYTVDAQGGWDVMFGLWAESTLETSLDYRGWFDDYIIARLVGPLINIVGTWSGILTQQPDRRFFYKMVLSQEGTTVSGTSRVEWAEDPQYYKITRIEGTIVDGEFIYRDTEILEERPRPGIYWCLITRAELTFAPGLDVDSLSGPYVCMCEADECLPGEIYLERHE